VNIYGLNVKNIKLLGSSARILAFSAIFLFASAPPASFAAGEEAEGPPWYEVEVIIFLNKDTQGQESETWPENTAGTQYTGVIDLALPGRVPTNAQLPPVNMQAAATSQRQPDLRTNPYADGAYVLLGKKFMQLSDTASRLRSSGDYEVLLHLAWRQPTFSEDQALPVFVYDGMTEPFAAPRPESNQDAYAAVGPQYPRLSGTLRLSVSRYLHLETDLHLKLPVTVQETLQPTIPAQGESQGMSFGSFFGMSEEPTPIMIERKIVQDYRLYETRRMRSTEVHFFDHPLIGVIATVTPYELPVVEPQVTEQPKSAVLDNATRQTVNSN
jgi:hypothetical protein